MIFILRIKKKKEQQRYAEEQRILRMNLPEEPHSGEKMSELLAQLQLSEVEGTRQKQQQREKEYQRYSDKFCMKSGSRRDSRKSVFFSLQGSTVASHTFGVQTFTRYFLGIALRISSAISQPEGEGPGTECGGVLAVRAGSKIGTWAHSLSSGSLPVLSLQVRGSSEGPDPGEDAVV